MEVDRTYVSQMVILTRRLSTFMALTLKSTPIVGCIASKTSSVNRRRMEDLPTPLSPTRRILNVSSNSMGWVGRWRGPSGRGWRRLRGVLTSGGRELSKGWSMMQTMRSGRCCQTAASLCVLAKMRNIFCPRLACRCRWVANADDDDDESCRSMWTRLCHDSNGCPLNFFCFSTFWYPIKTSHLSPGSQYISVAKGRLLQTPSHVGFGSQSDC